MREELDPSSGGPELWPIPTFQAYVFRLRTLPVKPFDGVKRDILWLVQGEEVLGRVTVIHTLTDATRDIGGNISYFIRPSARGKGYAKRALQLSLDHARRLGMTEVLVTVLSDNPASERVIQSAGAKLQSVSDLGDGRERRRYILAL
ncbi:MAG TPA: GNAT family N-acetyltransferase [Thermoanaerobaculia bacterium]